MLTLYSALRWGGRLPLALQRQDVDVAVERPHLPQGKVRVVQHDLPGGEAGRGGGQASGQRQRNGGRGRIEGALQNLPFMIAAAAGRRNSRRAPEDEFLCVRVEK